MHAFKLIGMLLDAHMNLMTIDIVRLLYSPKMVRLPSPSSRLVAAYLHATHAVVHALLPQLLDNIKEVQEVLLAASLAKGDADFGDADSALRRARTHPPVLSRSVCLASRIALAVYTLA